MADTNFYSEHIEYLLVKYDLYVARWLKRPAWNSTDLDGDDLRIAVIKCEESYCSALHELGHILKKTKDESTAWQWAKENAIHWTDKMQEIADKCLGLYAEKNSIKLKEST